MQILFLFIVSHESHRLSSFFSFFFFFIFLFAPLTGANNVLAFRSLILSSAQSSLLMKLSIEFFSSVIVFFNSKIFFYGYCFLTELLVLFMHCFPNFV